VAIILCALLLGVATRCPNGRAFTIPLPSARRSALQVRAAAATGSKTKLSSSADPSVIVSPFDESRNAEGGSSGSSSTATTTTATSDGFGATSGPLDLTWENVELVLDEMRPYLIQDGGNVKIADIDGPVVRLQLEGACGTCPSSTQTMKMGLERGLKEKIPEIQEVVQSMPEGPPLNEEQVDVILDGVRPFLKVAGGSIHLDRFEGLDGLQPTIWLKMEGASATLNSVKLEIAQRLQRHFMVAGLRVEWV
jgi:Fe-S cluster biogenesis protein NfuA